MASTDVLLGALINGNSNPAILPMIMIDNIIMEQDMRRCTYQLRRGMVALCAVKLNPPE